jgi:hypothetical protein
LRQRKHDCWKLIFLNGKDEQMEEKPPPLLAKIHAAARYLLLARSW